MGWKDAPVVDEAPAPAWQSAPLADAAEPPSTVEVALNAVPKGVANLLNTPITLKNLAMLGLSKLPGIGDIDAVQDIASHPTPNYPMQLAEQMGLVDPAKDPQTGLQRVVDAVIQGGIGGVVGPGGVIKNLAIGAGSAAAGQVTKEATGSDALAMAVGIGTALAPAAIQAAKNAATKVPPKLNPIKEATLKEAQEAGYVVQPTQINPSFKNMRLESIAGKAAVAQEATLKNQAVTNKLAARALGLADDTPFEPAVLQQVKDEATKPYRDIAHLSPKAAHALEELQQTRFEAKEQWQYYNRSGNPEAGKLARKLDADAANFEHIIDTEAQRIAGNQPSTLLPELREGRKRLAKLYVVEKALNEADGNVSAHVLGKMLDRGAPLTDELRIIGKFANAFRRESREVAGLPPPSSSGVDAASSAVLGTMGAGAVGLPGVVAGGLPLLRGPARRYLTDPTKGPQQRLLASVNATLPAVDFSSAMIRGGLAGRSLLDVLGEQGGE